MTLYIIIHVFCSKLMYLTFLLAVEETLNPPFLHQAAVLCYVNVANMPAVCK